jgi:3-oxoacyl-[acyl-carrier protein] reductase
MSTLADQVVLVAGGDQTAAAIAERLVEAGATVIVAGQSPTEASAIARPLARAGARITPLECDPRPSRCAAEAIGATVEAHGRVDLVVIAVRQSEERSLLRIDLHSWDEAVARELAWVFTFAQASARTMTEQRAGRIVVVAGGADLLAPAFGQAHVATTVAGVCGIVRFLSAELRHKAVTANAILWTPAGGPAGRPPAEHGGAGVAPLVCFLASPEAAGITGQVINSDGPALSLLRFGRSVGAVSESLAWSAEEISR